jgi:hypothetical protein
MLKEVGASGQISLGKKYAGQLFDMQIAQDGSVKLTPVKVVPMDAVAQEERAVYNTAPPERPVRRAEAAARSPAELVAARDQWEQQNKESLEAMNQRMAKIGSMSRRIHEWRTEQSDKVA